MLLIVIKMAKRYLLSDYNRFGKGECFSSGGNS
ncbi:hypothetical protein BB2000_0110 [Proteus mirabilis BB2000]|nr:hypothetical protein BB2000_0110 [Proteus mirabilis BB2000]